MNWWKDYKKLMNTGGRRYAIINLQGEETEGTKQMSEVGTSIMIPSPRMIYCWVI